MNFATWSIRNPIPSILLFALLSIAGIWGFIGLPVQNLPDLDLPTVTISMSEPGAAPAQLETEVARKVEDSLATLTGLRHIRTTIGDGVVLMRVEFVLEKPLSDAVIETKNAVDRIRSDLPTTLVEPAIAAAPFGSSPTLVYSARSDRMDEAALAWFTDDTIAKTVLAVPGVGRFERLGGVQREVRVDVDAVRLASLRVTPADVSRALRQVQQQSSGGRGQLGGAEQSIRTTALVAHASDLAALPIVLPDGRQVRLDQVATVGDANAERTQAALLDGRPALGFNVFRAKGFDETQVAAGVRLALDRLSAKHPGLSFAPVSGSVDYTVEQYRGSMEVLYGGAILAVLVVWLFLRDWRATLIAATALPLSILPAFAAMRWLGYSLNTLTLLALSVIVGILVDDAIVEIENIERHRRMGKTAQEATEAAVVEIALAVTATTMSLIAVFLPTALMKGIPGLLFKQFGWTAVIAVFASLVVARLLTPLMAAKLLRPSPSEEPRDGWMMSAYLHSIRWCLVHRRLTATAAAVFMALSLALVPLLPTGFLPSSDRGSSTVSIELPPGSSLTSTLGVAEAARAALAGVPGIGSVFTTVGQAGEPGQSFGEVRRASLIVTLLPRGNRPGQAAVEREIRGRLDGVPGARFAVSGGSPGERLELILASGDDRALKTAAQAVERQLRGVGHLANITSTASLERQEIVVRPDLARAADQGVTTAALGDLTRVATSGDFDAQVARLNLDDRQIYVRVRLSDAVRTSLEALANLRVEGRHGAVPLSSVANLSVASGPSEIDRFDRRRYVTISADLGGMPLGTALAAARALPAMRVLPSSVEMIEAGDAELAKDLASSFVAAILVGILCIYCVLVLLFKDVFQPFTILSAIPLSIGGAFLALVAGASELDIPAMIGLVMLTGIVTKNSILLVEYAVIGIRERGLSRREALIDACHKRARPIVMTTVAMIAGMTPIALGLGADASFRQPMATAVIGGLLTSTALSLLVVPVAFTYVDDLERRLRGWFARPRYKSGGARQRPSPVTSWHEPARGRDLIPH